MKNMKRKIFGLLVLVLFLATTTFSVIGNINNYKDEYILPIEEEQNNIKKSPDFSTIPSFLAPSPIIKQSIIVEEDWNYWDNYPNMFTMNDGNVGIGLSDPESKLEVVGNIEADSFTINGVPIGTSSDSYWSKSPAPWFAIYLIDENVGIGTSSPGDKLEVIGGVRANYLRALINEDLSFKTDDGATRMIIEDNGEIGIGLSNPEDDLHVKGDGWIQAIFESSDSSGGIKLISDTGQEYEIQSAPGDATIVPNYFLIYDKSDEKYRLAIDKEGNIVIPTPGSGIKFSDGTTQTSAASGFPAPNYDSGWITIPGPYTSIRTLTHNLGGNIDNYVVDIQSKTSGVGINNGEIGGFETDFGVFGFYYKSLTSTTIDIVRYIDDPEENLYRLRIWVYD